MIKKTRNANMDLLRIISMFLIIFLHSTDHSGVLENAEGCNTPMYFYVRFTYAACMVCVNLYVMLSGYFMINSKFRLHKLVTLWAQAAFYSFVLKLLFMIAGEETFSVISLVSCLFPILTGRYWFLTIYVGLYLISPFLNIFIKSMNKKQHLMLNICLFFIMSVWVSVHPSIKGMNTNGGWSLAWFVVLYLTASWLRLYYDSSRKTKWNFILAYPFIALVVSGAQVISKIVDIGVINSILNNFYRYDSVPAYLMSLCIFICFINVEIRNKVASKFISLIATLTFGVYLIHAHSNVTDMTWSVLNMPSHMNSALFVPFQLAIVIAIFAICAALEYVRKVTIGKLETLPAVIGACEKIQVKIKNVFLDF